MVVIQGRKEIQIGTKTVTYDSSRIPKLTSVDLPTVTRVSRGSEAQPCLAATLKLDISIVREFWSRQGSFTLIEPTCR